MRITNPMVSNRMLLNINRNARLVDRLYGQLSTGKQINYPSDNPILAGRALKFRTNVYETEQYQRNAAQGLSWMEITEGGFTNANSILTRIRELAVQGASDENRYDDRQKIVSDIEQLVKQLGTEMNVTYAGRYVFSGYRTDQPPVLEKNNSEVYVINQTFQGADIETTSMVKSVDMGGYTTLEKIDELHMIKLPYSTGVNDTTISITVGDPATAVTMEACDTIDDYDTATNPADPGKAYYIKDTGEIILGADLATKVSKGEDLNISYTKSGFEKGELNPIVYFDCIHKTADGDVSYNMDNQDMEYEFSVNTRINVNSLAKDVYTDKMYADLVEFCKSISNLPVNTMESLVASGLTSEEAQAIIDEEEDLLRQVTQSRFNNLLGIVDRHASVVTTQHTDLGSRMSRLELIANRLMDDRLNYKELLSQNEDVDYLEATMELNAAESVYQAALQVGAKIIQLTLADYIR